jgi:hypothetical protein
LWSGEYPPGASMGCAGCEVIRIRPKDCPLAMERDLLSTTPKFAEDPGGAAAARGHSLCRQMLMERFRGSHAENCR